MSCVEDAVQLYTYLSILVLVPLADSHTTPLCSAWFYETKVDVSIQSSLFILLCLLSSMIVVTVMIIANIIVLPIL